MRYIFILEDGHPYQADEISDDDIHAFEDGLLDILDVKEMKQLSIPSMGIRVWVEIDTWVMQE